MITKTKRSESEELLSRNRLGRLGCVLEDGGPYVIPVNYLYRNGNIFIHSYPGQKITALKANNSACLQTDEISADGFTWQSAIAFGDFEILSEEDEIGRVLDALFEAFPGFTPVEANISSLAEESGPIVFRIRIKEITGVKEGS